MYQVKDGRDTSFWEDIWIGNVPVKTLYPNSSRCAVILRQRVIDYWDGTALNGVFPLEEVCLSLRCTVLIIYY